MEGRAIAQTRAVGVQKLMKKIAKLLMTVALLIVPALAQQDTVVEEIVVRVNNAIITRADIKRGEEQLGQELKQQNPPPSEEVVAERNKDLLRDLIDQQLLLQKGQDLGISGEADVIKRLDEIRKQMKANSMEDLEKMAQQQGISFEDFKQNMKNNIITQKVIGQEVGGKIQITPTEIQAYYDEHKAELEQPERIRLSELLISLEPPKKEGEQASAEPVEPDAATVAAAKAKAEALLKDIKDGALFDEVAKKNSNGPTAEQGGDLGYFKRGMLAKELEDTTFAMQAGDVSDVIRTKQGFVILKVTEHPPAGIPAMKSIEPQIQEALYVQKLNPALRKYLTQLREEAYIDMKPGYVDTGASPNQTKPVIATAGTPEQPEAEKKKKKKFLIF
jgi:peptidyl-prolyl cis-trans isomerase SurA